MDHFTYREGILHAEDIPLPALAAQVGTPFYVYAQSTLTHHYHVFVDAFARHDIHNILVAYAVKANSNIAVLKCLAQSGAGADVVSAGELARALHAGIPAKRIVFSGVGKTSDELAFALRQGIGMINVESIPELHLLNQVAQDCQMTAPVSIRINPDVDAQTHAKIATGKKETKFGINIDQAPAVFALGQSLPHLAMIGVDMHIGSQLTQLEPFAIATDLLLDMVRHLRNQGHAISHIDLGGGLGISYDQNQAPPPSPDAYAAVLAPKIKGIDATIAFEPGRLIAGNAGLLVSQVIYEKPTAAKNFLIIDAAMNDLMRPALYDAHHEIQPVCAQDADHLVDVVGPVCETGDIFAKQIMLPHLKEGDLVALRSAGAYGAVMASEYNTRPLIPEVMVYQDRWALIRRRPTFEEMIERESFAPWQTTPSTTSNP